MTNIQPCPSCVETIADLRQAVSDAIHNAYVSGALDVHNNYQEDRDPSFGEAAADYVASLDVNDMLAHFLPKSPAQLLAEECPHGMTEEQAQWVLDHFADAVKPIEATCKQPLQVQSDAAPRYVFGRILMPGRHKVDEYKVAFQGHEKIYRKTEVFISGGDVVCRAYRIGQPYPHDGGECPLADGSVRVLIENNYGQILNMPASQLNWKGITGFTPLDQGSGQ